MMNSTLETFKQYQGHLMLHFDINKTLVATDCAGGKPDVDMVVQELLAEKTFACWTEQLDSPISYSEYVKKHLCPGSKRNPKIKAERFKYLHHFLNDHKECDFYPELSQKFKAITEKLKGATVFDSFFKLLETLEKANITATVIFRTFGEDLDTVIECVEKKVLNAKFIKASFKKGELYCEGERFSKVDTMKQHLKQHRWVAIQDDWHYWSEHQQEKDYGKPFPLPSKDKNEQALFFDDNVDQNIIAPMSPKGETCNLPQNSVQVDTIDAILNDNYFVEKVENILKLGGSNDSK